MNKIAEIYTLLKECTIAQQKFFYVLYPNGMTDANKDRINRAHQQILATIAKNKKDPETIILLRTERINEILN